MMKNRKKRPKNIVTDYGLIRERKIQQRILSKKVVENKRQFRLKNHEFRIDYKNARLLRRQISFQGKILPRRVSRLTAKKQRKMAKAIKTARLAGLLVFISRY